MHKNRLSICHFVSDALLDTRMTRLIHAPRDESVYAYILCIAGVPKLFGAGTPFSGMCEKEWRRDPPGRSNAQNQLRT
jgi:hypothetical protein